MLKFFRGNAKLDKRTLTFSLPSGWACPGARQCLARVNPTTGKLKDGPQSVFRCFSASQETLYSNVRKSRWENFHQLKSLDTQAMADLLLADLEKNRKIKKGVVRKVRVHVSGDFFSQDYFDAWLIVARAFPKLTFYAYTKSLGFWIKRLNDIPENFVLNASKGGKFDYLISKFNLKSAKVVFSREEAKREQLKIDTDDGLAANRTGEDFALLIHGRQPAKSMASKALTLLK